MKNNNNTVSLFRTAKTALRYLEEKKIGSDKKMHAFENYLTNEAEKIIHKSDHCFIIENLFPYDNLAEISHLLIPLIQVPFQWGEIRQEVMEDIRILRDDGYLRKNYAGTLESLPSSQSKPEWFHIHLLSRLKVDISRVEYINTESKVSIENKYWQIKETQDIFRTSHLTYEVFPKRNTHINWDKLTLNEKWSFHDLRVNQFNKYFDNIIEIFTNHGSRIFVIKEKQVPLSNLR